jgi:hypothetical protein
MLLSLPAAAWVAALIAAGLTLRSLTALRASFRGIALFLVAGAAMFIVAIALQSLTDQWQRWTSDGAFQSWLPTRYAYFGVATMVAAGLAALARVPRVGAVLGAVIIFVGALGTAAVNQPIARSMRIQSAKFEAYDTALRCATTRGWLAGQNVLAPRLFDWVDFAETQDVAFFDVWAQRRGVTLRLTQQLDARGPHASFDVRLDGDGTLLAALVAGPAPDARGMLVRRNYEGFVGWRDESGQRQMPLDTATTRCADTQFALVQLPPNALLDTVALSPLPLRAHFPIVPLYTVFWMERPTPLLGDGWNRPPDGQASWMKDDHATLWFEPMQVPANGLQLTLTMLGTAHVRVRDGEKILAEAQLTWDEQRILFDLPPGSGAMRLDLDRGEGTAGLRWLLLTNRP